MALAMPEPRCIDIDQILEQFMLTRGIKDIVDLYGEVIAKSPFAPILVGYEFPHDAEIRLPDTVKERLNDLAKLVESTCHEDHLMHCKEAILHLQIMYRLVAYYQAKDNLQTGR